MRIAKRAIGEIELDLGRYELRRSGRRVKLEKKPMELLIFLVGRREQMVSREDIVREALALGSVYRYRPERQQYRAKNSDALWVTTPLNRALLKLSLGKGTDSSVRCG